MKHKAIPFLLGLVALGALSSCVEKTVPATSSSTPASSAPSESSMPTLSTAYTDVDTISLDSGEYMVADTIYSFDKENKKVKVTKYEDYDSYKNKQGNVLYDGAVRFVKASSMLSGEFDAAYFEISEIVYLLYKDSSGVVRLASRRGTIESTSSAALVKDIPLFTMGNYVSEKQTQNQANEEGSYLYDSQGNSIKEDFYLFLELSETKASIFLGKDATTHDQNPLHSVENYKTQFVAGKLQIKIPHKDGDFACTLTSFSETEIKFVNSMERRGDYSCSGTFTKIA